jgi:hypothetical protein
MRAFVRPTAHLLVAVIAFALLAVVATPADAAGGVDADAGTLTLATEGGEGEPGPEPMGPNQTENPAAPGNWAGPPFARFVALVLTIAALGGMLSLGGLYWLLVKRPQQRQHSAA